MFCENCGTKLQDSDRFCPECGTPVPEDLVSGAAADATVKEAQPKAEAALGPGAETDSLKQPETASQAETAKAEEGGESKAQPETAAESPVESKPETAAESPAEAKPETAQAQTAAKTGEQQPKAEPPKAGTAASGEEKKPPKKKKGFWAAAAVALLAVVLACAFGVPARVGNLLRRTFSSPEKYYQYVEKKSFKGVAAGTADLYQLYLLDNKNPAQTAASVDLALQLDQGGKDFLELAGLAGVDLSWLDSAGAAMRLNPTEDKIGAKLSVNVNKTDVCSLAMALDIEAMEAYLQIPELTDTYIGADLRDALGSAYAKTFSRSWEERRERYKEAMADMPGKTKLARLLDKYAGIALSCVEDVDKKSKTLRIEGVEQQCTALEVTLDARTAADMLDAVLSEAEDDEALEELIANFAEAAGIDGSDTYDVFLDRLDALYKAFAGNRGGEALMTVYVNGKGEIVGRELEAGDLVLAWLMPQKGNRFGLELSASQRGESYSLTGEGKRFGSRIDGELNVRYNGAPVLDVTADNLNLDTLKQGQLNGKLEIRVGSGIQKAAGAVEGLSVLQDMQITLNAKSSADSAKFTLGLFYDGESMGSVTVNAQSKKSSKVKIPKEKNVVFVEGLADLEDWLDEINWDKVVSRLEKAGLPRSVTSAIENLGDRIEDGDYSEIMDALYELMYLMYYDVGVLD